MPLLPFPRYGRILVENRYPLPLYLAPPLEVTPSDFRNDPPWQKTRMIGLSDRERISMIHSAVLIQITRVTGRQTDGQTELAWHIHAIAYTLSRIKNSTLLSTVHRQQKLLVKMAIFYGDDWVRPGPTERNS